MNEIDEDKVHIFHSVSQLLQNKAHKKTLINFIEEKRKVKIYKKTQK